MKDLQKENDELRANLTEIKRAWQITTNDDYHAMVAAMNKTPTQSLADIKAEAVNESVEFIRDRFNPSNEDEHRAYLEIDDMLTYYAKIIK